jgi:thioredoxin-like negative regulator of GroEL
MGMLNIFKRNVSVFVAAAFVIGGVVSVARAAASWKTYDNAAFKAALESGRTVLVDFHATWCPTCKQQRASLDKVLADKEFQGVSAFIADYDTSTDLKREMQIRAQSTLVLFKGGHEVGRSTGVTDPDDLRALLRKSL